eukprot:SAG31_NODE_528_length_14438_cov_2.252877_4_plen_117_part_00
MAAQSKPSQAGPVVDAAAAAAAKRGLWTVTAGFFFTFAGYAAIENLLSTFHARLGYYSSAMVYYCISPGAFVAPWIIGKLGPQLAMGLGAITCEHHIYPLPQPSLHFASGKAVAPA